MINYTCKIPVNIIHLMFLLEFLRGNFLSLQFFFLFILIISSLLTEQITDEMKAVKIKLYTNDVKIPV